MSLKVSTRIAPFLALPCLWSCQVVSGLADLELDASSGGQAAGGGTGTGGEVGTGAASCLVGWETHTCSGLCGDPGDGVWVGCGNLMDCYLEEQCLPAQCSAELNDVCGGNKVENATSEALQMAREVVECMCPPP